MEENVGAGHSTHRGAGRARWAFTAFQSKCALQSNESGVGHRGDRPRGWAVSSSVPHRATHSPLGQEALDPQGSRVTQEGHLSRGGRQDLGHPETRAIEESLSNVQERGKCGGGGGLPPQAQPGLRQGLICSKELPELSLGPNMGAEGSPASMPMASFPDSEGPPGDWDIHLPCPRVSCLVGDTRASQLTHVCAHRGVQDLPNW